MQYMLLAVKKTISKPYVSLWDDFQDTESEKRQKKQNAKQYVWYSTICVEKPIMFSMRRIPLNAIRK